MVLEKSFLKENRNTFAYIFPWFWMWKKCVEVLHSDYDKKLFAKSICQYQAEHVHIFEDTAHSMKQMNRMNNKQIQIIYRLCETPFHPAKTVTSTNWRMNIGNLCEIATWFYLNVFYPSICIFFALLSSFHIGLSIWIWKNLSFNRTLTNNEIWHSSLWLMICDKKKNSMDVKRCQCIKKRVLSCITWKEGISRKENDFSHFQHKLTFQIYLLIFLMLVLTFPKVRNI